MKKTLLTLTLALAATTGFAQTMYSPSQVCQRVAAANTQNGGVCAKLISRNSYDQSALDLAYQAVPQGSSHAISILEVTANRRLEPSAAKVCGTVFAANPQNSIVCLEIVLDRNPSEQLLRIATLLVSKGSVHAVGALRVGVEAYFYEPLMSVCEAMVGANPGNTIVCLETIANKISQNGSEQICKTTLSRGSAYTLECLRGIVLDYTPFPGPTSIMVELYQIQDLKRTLMKTRALLERGMIDQAKRSVNDSLELVDFILNNQKQF